MQGIGTTTVFVDANVWFSRTLRDWLGMLYTTPDDPPFVACWTEDVLAELIYHLRRAHPRWDGARITRIRDLLADTFEAGRVDDFTIDAGYGGPDPSDAHVHAAAVACRADVLLTCNTRDFVWDDSASPYEVMHPDDFLVLVDDSCPSLVATVAAQMARYWYDRFGEADVPARLRSAQCPQFAERVRRHLIASF
ncbi:PIN domain-containing protein [Cellulomonas sp. FA1]|uniref:PIN domain-containing protein n=1 Tax=Cellulomonas sp. FA1 TaxID=1346710 RepID=UPI000625C4C0|nr:PIN domain-containing protein [Cellulomonas sp. FA1]